MPTDQEALDLVNQQFLEPLLGLLRHGLDALQDGRVDTQEGIQAALLAIQAVESIEQGIEQIDGGMRDAILRALQHVKLVSNAPQSGGGGPIGS